MKDRKRQSKRCAKAIDRSYQRWTPEADLSVVQPVGPHTSRKEIQSLYLEVYKQWRLPGSPPGEPELMEEVVSSFDDCQGQKQRRAPETAARPQPNDVWPHRHWTPERGRRESSVERSLSNVRGAHQKVLAMVTALKKEIEQLIHSPPGVSPSWEHTPGVGTTRHMDPGGRKGDTARCTLRAAWPPTSNITLPEGIWSLAERQWLSKTLTWRSHWNWGQKSPASSGGWPRTWKEKKRHPFPKPSEGAP